MKIIVSNPSKQYAHQTVAALRGNKQYEVLFLTSFWFMPNRYKWHKWASAIPFIKNQMRKKSSEVVPDYSVVLYWKAVLFAFFGRLFYQGEQRSFIEDQIHDKWASKWITSHQPNIVIGYEKSCLLSFQAAKKYGGITILDLAQVHVNFIESLRKKYDFFRQITGNNELFTAVKNNKIAEYNLADNILCLSNFAANTLKQNDITASKIMIANIGANSQLFTPKQKYNQDKNQALQLLFVGTVTKRKGIHLLLEALADLLHLNLSLTIIGPMGDGFQIEPYLASNKNIIYYPFLHHEELAKKMQSSDIFVFPSFLDSWAMVVIEAMASGLPVVVTDNTGAAEVVTDAAGKVIQTGNKEQLKFVIEFFYENRMQIQTMGLNARTIAEKYSWSNYANQLNKNIQQIVALS